MLLLKEQFRIVSWSLKEYAALQLSSVGCASLKEKHRNCSSKYNFECYFYKFWITFSIIMLVMHPGLSVVASVSQSTYAKCMFT